MGEFEMSNPGNMGVETGPQKTEFQQWAEHIKEQGINNGSVIEYADKKGVKHRAIVDCITDKSGKMTGLVDLKYICEQTGEDKWESANSKKTFQLKFQELPDPINVSKFAQFEGKDVKVVFNDGRPDQFFKAELIDEKPDGTGSVGATYPADAKGFHPGARYLSAGILSIEESAPPEKTQ